MLSAMKRGRFPPVPEVGNRRSMVHVADVVAAALLAANHPKAIGEIFIVSDGYGYSTRQIADWVRESLGRRPFSWSVPLWGLQRLAATGDLLGRLRRRRFVFDSTALERLVGSSWFSAEKIQQTLGFQPRLTLKEAIPEMIGRLDCSGATVRPEFLRRSEPEDGRDSR
jgi:nucleoside-diphosphate-sugar epimerase